MRTLELMPLCADPLLFWASLIAAAAFGCGSGGQSFDDGSGDLGRGKRSQSAPPDIGVQIWSHYMIPGMVARIVSGHSEKKVIDWAKSELEGLRR